MDSLGKERILAVNSGLAFRQLEKCELCPRKCRVNRLKGQKGFCKTGAKPVVYSYFPHFGEEPPISGTRGSGAIFFTHCTMNCVYCQNYSFSQLSDEKEITTEELTAIMLKLEKEGCHNINLVTPTHFVPQILEALLNAVRKGLTVPVVYNTSGYDSVETLKLLDGVIDIYLPDMRYADDSNAKKFSNAPGYTAANQNALKEMFRQVGLLVTDKEIAKKGLIIRHLVLPEAIASTEKVFGFISRELSKDIHISLMSQYHPVYQAGDLAQINRRITKKEYAEAVELFFKYGLVNGWVQDFNEKTDSTLLGTNIKKIG